MAEFWEHDRIAAIPRQDGEIPFKIASINKPVTTFYTVFGDLTNGTTPLVVLHGTSSGFGYILPFAELWLTHGIPVVFYDQIGCGRSTRLPETKGNKAFWQPSLFIAELDNLLDHLALRPRGYHLLGHSWGGMWGGEFAASHPSGLQRLVLASPCAATELVNRSFEINKKLLSPEDREAIDTAIQTSNFDSPEFANADRAYDLKFLSGIDPFPLVMQAAGKAMHDDPTVSQTLFGSTQCDLATGSLKGWTSISKLPQITAPTLVYNSEFDVCHDVAVKPYFDCIPRVRWVSFPDASHMVHLQDNGRREKVVKLVGDFLTVKSE